MKPLHILFALSNMFAPEPQIPQFCNARPDPIPNSQTPRGEPFIGSPVSAKPLHKKFWHEPRSSALHIDAGNTRTVDYPGPLGRNITVTSYTLPFVQTLFDFDDSMFVVYGGGCNGSHPILNSTRAFALVDPKNFDILDAWQPPPPATNNLTLTYMQVLMDESQIVLSTADTIFVLQKCGTKLRAIRTIELRSTISKYPLIASVMDAIGNIWFTTGNINLGTGAVSASNSFIGYVAPNDDVKHIELPGLLQENGIAINNDTMFFAMGPAAGNNHANATGYIQKVTSSPDGLRVLWNSSYDAGSDSKYRGSFARGSGTTPSLLGNDFVALNDNADNQTNVVVYSQKTGEQICKVPVFQNGGRTDNCGIAHFDGKDYGYLLQNQFNIVPITATSDPMNPSWINGAWQNQASWNNNSVQSAGISKFIVKGDGSGCHVEWTNTDSGIMSTAPILSTATGLVYGYEQSVSLAKEGQWEWYTSAIDWMTGKTVWKVRTGAGGSFNNFLQVTFLGTDGSVRQSVLGGYLSIKDA